MKNKSSPSAQVKRNICLARIQREYFFCLFNIPCCGIAIQIDKSNISPLDCEVKANTPIDKSAV